MILSDNSIKEKLKSKEIYINPFAEKNLQGMNIAQIAFEELNKPCQNPYGTKDSQMFKNF